MANDGFWLIDKESGWTSFDVCAKMRKKLNIKKVGHTGTLDPFATGLLIVATGRATKLIPFLEKCRKTYQATIVLGKISDTLDSESDVREMSLSSIPTQEQIETVLKEKFQGKISQMPPQFSAIKIEGRPAYKAARAGEKVNLVTRETEIFHTRILSYHFPEISIELEVAAGFYVRSFARDLGSAFGGGGYCSALRRTKIQDLVVEDADKLEHMTQPIDPRYILTSLSYREILTGRVQDFISGRAFPLSGVEKEKILVLVGGKTIGVGEILHGKLQPRVVL